MCWNCYLKNIELSVWVSGSTCGIGNSVVIILYTIASVLLVSVSENSNTGGVGIGFHFLISVADIYYN